MASPDIIEEYSIDGVTLPRLGVAEEIAKTSQGEVFPEWELCIDDKHRIPAIGRDRLFQHQVALDTSQAVAKLNDANDDAEMRRRAVLLEETCRIIQKKVKDLLVWQPSPVGAETLGDEDREDSPQMI